MKVFRDLLYGEIQVSEVAVGLIDTREFQRLRSINQTGAAKFVFPSATTTRFEHSIGTYHLRGIFLLQLGIPETSCLTSHNEMFAFARQYINRKSGLPRYEAEPSLYMVSDGSSRLRLAFL